MSTTKTAPAMTRALAESVSRDMAEAMKAVADRHGLKLEMLRGSYDDTTFTKQVRFNIVAADGQALTKEWAHYQKFAQFVRLDPTWLGLTFRASNGEVYRVVGLATRSQKMPVRTVRIRDGREFKHTIDAVRSGFGC